MSGILLLLLVSVAPQPAAVTTAVVCPAELRPALQPWIDFRAAQGHAFAYVDSTQSAGEIRQEIIKVSQQHKTLKNVLLVGDAAPATSAARQFRPGTEPDRKLQTPAHFAKAVVNIHFRSEPLIATDNRYADTDGDGLPDLAIGRLTADSLAELTTIVNKIIAYEKNPPAGAWRRQINMIAGVGGFGPMVDSVLEMATKKFMVEGIPPGYCTTMTYGSWRSPYCPPPHRFHAATMDRMNEGSLLWIYIGHGQRASLDRVRTPIGAHHILDVNDVRKIDSKNGPPIAVFLACYTGAFDEPRDCIAEELLRAPNGPVACYSGSRVTMPYAMTIMAHEMLKAYFIDQKPTLGEVILQAKRNMVGAAKDDAQRRMIDSLAAVISPKPELLTQERAEHLRLFNLIGDPLLRVPQPETIQLQTPEKAAPGDTLQVSGETPLGGKCIVELSCRRDRSRFRAPVRETYVRSQQAEAAYARAYQQANDRAYVRHEVQIKPGPFKFKLKAPAGAHGPSFVRMYVEGQEKRFAIGSSPVHIGRVND